MFRQVALITYANQLITMITNLKLETIKLNTTHFHFHKIMECLKNENPSGVIFAPLADPPSILHTSPSTLCLYSSNPPGSSMPGKSSPTAPWACGLSGWCPPLHLKPLEPPATGTKRVGRLGDFTPRNPPPNCS